jgi:MFS family permease
VFFGWLSDHIGRKPVVLAGSFLGAVAFYPIYLGLAHYAAPANKPALFALILLQMSFGTMTYGPMAAWLVEMFPTRIRYTALSLPYHLGIGVLGGCTPFVATKLVALTNNPYAGLAYPIAVAALSFLIGLFFLHEERGAALDR